LYNTTVIDLARNKAFKYYDEILTEDKFALINQQYILKVGKTVRTRKYNQMGLIP
jgi:hypothetical protein